MRPIQSIQALVLSFSLVACGPPYGGHSASQTGGDRLHELEPNDDAAHADYLGELQPGDYLAVEGHISECCDDDFDGFAFHALGPLSVSISLHEYAPHADLDFAIYIPELDQFVDSWETDNHPEIGVFHIAAAGDFHIVVDAFHGDSTYLLEVDARPFELNLGQGPGMSATGGTRFEGYRREGGGRPLALRSLVRARGGIGAQPDRRSKGGVVLSGDPTLESLNTTRAPPSRPALAPSGSLPGSSPARSVPGSNRPCTGF